LPGTDWKRQFANYLLISNVLYCIHAQLCNFQLMYRVNMSMGKVCGLFVLGCMPLALDAQHIHPVSGGNYSGILSTQLNPALAAHSPYNWHLHVAGIRGNVNNTYLQLRLPYSPLRVLNNRVPEAYKDNQGNAVWRDNWLDEHRNGKPDHFTATAGVIGPSLLVKAGKWQIGFLTEANGHARLNGLYEPLVYALKRELDTGRRAYDFFHLHQGRAVEPIPRLTLHAAANTAMGVHVSREIPLQWNSKLAAGISIRRHYGLGGAAFRSEALEIRKVNGDSVLLSSTRMEAWSYEGKGRGSGIDLGVVYTFNRPDYRRPGGYGYRHPRYALRTGIAIMDIGAVRYQEAIYHTWINNQPVGWNLRSAEARYQNQEPGFTLAENVLNDLPGYTTGTSSVRVGLPTRLVLSADYQMHRNWFIQTQWVQSLRSRYNLHMRHQSYLMLSPRYEKEFIEFSLPTFLAYDYSALRMGAALRLGPIYLGTNSLKTLLRPARIRDADFYIGIIIANLPGTRRSRLEKATHEVKPRRHKADCGDL
jgi:hypothetical protein